MSSEQKPINNSDDSSRLSIMAAAIEHLRSTDDATGSGAASSGGGGSGATGSTSPARRMKLVLPNLTPAMQQDLALSKGSTGKSSRPLSITARPEYANYQLEGIVTPHPHDVLCGRGGGSNNHPGNESFRELVNEVKFPYVNCPKREKPLIARRIVEAVRDQTPPGRFLSKDSKTGMWNDIGDGKAREKTSQALREGAPIIRDMIGKPSSPTNVATALKEAKKAERAEKEYGVKRSSHGKDEALSPTSGFGPDDAHHAAARASPPLSSSDPALQRGTSMGTGFLGNSPRNVVMSNGASVPPLKKFRSFGGHDMAAAPCNNGQPPTAWPLPQQPARNFGMMPYAAAHHAGHMMGGFVPPPHRGPADYAGPGMPPPRYPPTDSVPVETVRRLLLGQLDPVQLALQILSPEEAGVVARRHAAMGLQHMSGGSRPPLHPPLVPLVSDGSSTSSSSVEYPLRGPVRRVPSDQSASNVQVTGGDDASSVDSSGPSPIRSNAEKGRALPKKKRKYVETNV